ncbi:hypothetical protein BJY00DRAFT_265959 [Aspergillus carlsbadensis]|nr:hypothetical protein BJY00DRAFT_265959 [Aspergillus carlsbadensis]
MPEPHSLEMLVIVCNYGEMVPSPQIGLHGSSLLEASTLYTIISPALPHLRTIEVGCSQSPRSLLEQKTTAQALPNPESKPAPGSQQGSLPMPSRMEIPASSVRSLLKPGGITWEDQAISLFASG